ncbi:MAG: glycosyltransferase family 2 protein [Gammaproteobacteria bacterium]|nr:glycosyltransferase family 2 protein [Gammaproteobacteria bacterium]
MKVAIVSIMKNESNYILEWLAYHRSVIGISNFIIADNVSDDGGSELLEALDQAGLIKRFFHPRVNAEVGVQHTAYERAIREYGSTYDYFLFLDADEFLVNETGIKLMDFLAKTESCKDFSALALNWRIFGSSGRKVSGDGLVIERFTRCSKPEEPRNCHIKTLARIKDIDKVSIHHNELVNGVYYNENLEPARFATVMLDREDNIADGPSPFTVEINNAKLYIAHFVIKSRQEHFEKKFKRGSAAGSLLREKGEGYFRSHDLCHHSCLDLSKHSTLVRQEIASLVKTLGEQTHYFAYVQSAFNKANNHFVGWVTSDSSAPIKLLLKYDNNELELELNVERPDLIRKEITNQIKSGFKLPPPAVKDESSLILKIKGNEHQVYPRA